MVSHVYVVLRGYMGEELEVIAAYTRKMQAQDRAEYEEDNDDVYCSFYVKKVPFYSKFKRTAKQRKKEIQ